MHAVCSTRQQQAGGQGVGAGGTHDGDEPRIRDGFPCPCLGADANRQCGGKPSEPAPVRCRRLSGVRPGGREDVEKSRVLGGVWQPSERFSARSFRPAHRRHEASMPAIRIEPATPRRRDFGSSRVEEMPRASCSTGLGRYHGAGWGNRFGHQVVTGEGAKDSVDPTSAFRRDPSPRLASLFAPL